MLIRIGGLMITDDPRDLLRRLSLLGDRLDEERASLNAPVMRATHSHERRRSRVPLVAAGVLLIVGAIGVAAAMRGFESESASVATPLPPDPPGPLFVLPGDLVRYPVSAGTISVADPAIRWPSGSYQWAAVGTKRDVGYDDVVAITVLGEDGRVDELLELGEWNDIDTATGIVHERQTSTVSEIVQQRGDRWIRLMSPHPDDTSKLVDLLSTLSLGESTDAIELTTGPYEIIEQGRELVRPPQNTTITVTAPVGQYWIETTSLSNPLATVGAIGDRIVPTNIGDHHGWLISRDTGHGVEPYAVIWRATPHRVIAVGTSADRTGTLDELVDVATQIGVVDETIWREALPQAQTETIT
jgi:hypothetical protein